MNKYPEASEELVDQFHALAETAERERSAKRSLQGRILITGGAGFIGRAIVKTAFQEAWPCAFTILSRDEQKQHYMKECVKDWTDLPRHHTHNLPDASVKYVIGDVNETDRLTDIMAGHDIVVHAAALKYIPEAEQNVSACINTNLQGSMSVAMAAKLAHVSRVVALSTDKATSPLNVYGATKLLMERLYAEFDQWSQEQPDGEPRFTTVRYGNVIGSTGSVIPMFLQQLDKYQHVTITEPRMTRFWIDYHQAIDLICEAAHVEDRGVTVIPKPTAMGLGELAEACRLVYDAAIHEEDGSRSFRAVGADADFIKVIGIRPGEKYHEALINESESLRTIDTGEFYYLYPPTYNNGGEAFELYSDIVPRMDPELMAECIRQAQEV